MIAYSKLIKHFKDLADSEEYIKTATQGQDIDLDKAGIFPLFNVDIVGSSFTSNATVTFDVVLDCLAVRSINKEDNTDKYWGNDNEIDNHNGTISALNNIWVKMHREFAKNNITASDSPSLEKITNADKNLLDGWRITFTVEMPSDGVDICFGC